LARKRGGLPKSLQEWNENTSNEKRGERENCFWLAEGGAKFVFAPAVSRKRGRWGTGQRRDAKGERPTKGGRGVTDQKTAEETT